ncbi:type III-A CRISPR-associated protein Cas10/Csm1, partial [Pseudoramibacter alactolyticus]
MNHDEIGLVIGGLLHDIGKAVYRQGGERKNHSELGYAFLKEKIGVKDADLLACVRYHHSDDLKNAHLAADAPAYIVYMADNMASAADRREKEQAEEFGFDQQTPLQPVFNLLNGNHGDKWYAPGILAVGEDHTADQINFPVAEKAVFSREQYNQIATHLKENLQGINWDQPQDYINSILEAIEANLSFIPSSTAKGEVPDISLYDHMKMTGAMAACIGQYLKAQSIQDYREVLFKQATAFYDRDVFLLASLDLSGIQAFIYTITSEDALRMLRARSFYLDLLVEHIVDSMLERLSLTRCNLIYAGGGHCYLLLPNTEQAKETFDNCLALANQWFLAQFGAALYIAGGYAPCSSHALCDKPKGRYADLFRAVSSKLSKQKMQRYSADDIRALNQRREKNYARECVVCKKIGAVNESGRCSMCEALKQLSAHVLYDWFFAITKAEDAAGVPLPFNSVLRAAQKESRVKAIIKDDPDFVRVYGKNQMYTGEKLSAKLWIGGYTTGDTFEAFAKQAQGIRRIAVLRADVDNLGHSFVAGFDDPANQNRYVTLSRTATLSRQLSLFFKFYINKILESPQFSLTDARPEKRAATIVYSGGDDVFIVGAWDQVI